MRNVAVFVALFCCAFIFVYFLIACFWRNKDAYIYICNKAELCGPTRS